ncbi:PREDICTED: CAS1 domain-containing protein 1 [Nicrophorus vespilloides]|uniref:CAS1 domain-containing protein 1 n=1 Tax=Nicrophorus vespilloides TaxID=110193 RepID=A0ABM1MTC3_NICVS|nr:PREDICTED: CAS1 domain-containing protein 1 [Nicrophorus vespilloides]
MVQKSKVEQVIEQINSTNAKWVALLMVIGFACYHELLHLRYGSNSCQWLLSNGRYKGDQEWQPYGCMLHHYSTIDTRRCLRYIAFYGKESQFIFIGDSRIRDLYVGFVTHLQQGGDVTSPPNEAETNLIHVDNKLKIRVEFIWSPNISKKMVMEFKKWKSAETPPSVVIAGCGLWVIKTGNASEATLQQYSVNLTRLVQPIDSLHRRDTKVLWALQEPVNTDKLKSDYHAVTNEQIDLYNKAAIEILSYSSAELWWSARLVAQGMLSESKDGIHLTPRSLQHNTQILLNMYCNDNMNFNDGTCCSSAETYTILQIVTFSILGVCVLIFIIMVLHRWYMKWRGKPVQEYILLPNEDNNMLHTPILSITPGEDVRTLFKSLTIVAVIMSYFFICDRTNFFMKENKYYSEFSFWLPIGYVFVLGLFFTEDSNFTKILHRDQMNEWKGWMQLVILVYHMTGASQILLINMHIKILISAYLFLLGYEQFVYMFQHGDLTLVGLFKMLFQLNFMTVTLCLCMNRPYQFYYFVPLLSFWYVMCYAALALPPLITAQSSENNIAQYFYLVIKFVALFSVITILFMSEVFFEKVFVTRPWKALFVTTDDDIHEWWSRWKLDRYSSLYGMLFGTILLLAQRYNLFDDNNHNNLFSRGIALSATLASLLGLSCYIPFTLLCKTEMDCSEIHSYIVCLPILSYVVLRNISGVLRTRYSSLFAWFGNISLELFISQYHIWLAADTHGVLVLIPGYPVLNVIITSFIFVCASHEIHRLTKVLLPYAIPADFKLALRNLILFMAILVPIGINDGMF